MYRHVIFAERDVPDQNAIFRSGEGDNWFRRNRVHLAKAGSDDRVSMMVMRLADSHSISSLCEVGCANGWRLALLQQEIGSLERIAGSDISAQAISDGRSQWPSLELTVGPADAPGLSGVFDVTIVSFVLHWVSRDKMMATIAAVDALVPDGGHLIVADFMPDRPCRRRYHHRDDVELFTYKQDYVGCFTGLGFYEAVETEIFSHGGQAVIDEQDRAVCALLKKSFASYATV